MLEAFAETYSLSLQQTLYQMGSRVIEQPQPRSTRSASRSRTSTTSWSTWSRSASRTTTRSTSPPTGPYGLIEATVLRDGASRRIPVDLTNL